MECKLISWIWYNDEAVKSALNIYKISHEDKDGNLERWRQYNKKSLSSGCSVLMLIFLN